MNIVLPFGMQFKPNFGDGSKTANHIISDEGGETVWDTQRYAVIFSNIILVLLITLIWKKRPRKFGSNW